MTAIVKWLRKPLPTFPIRRRDPSYRLCVRAAWNIGTLQEFVSFALALNEVIPARIKDSDTFLWTPGQILLQKGILPDICFTSLLKRAVRTLNYVLEETDLEWLPVVKTVMLNERHYGILQGLNKAETAIKYGEEQVRIWRRSYDVRPPALNEDDPRNPRLQKKYADSKIRPLCESLEDVVNRVLPYYDTNVLPLLWRGKNVLISAHGNTLRALCKTLDNLSEEELSRLEIPTGVPIVYTVYGHGTIQAKQLLY